MVEQPHTSDSSETSRVGIIQRMKKSNDRFPQIYCAFVLIVFSICAVYSLIAFVSLKFGTIGIDCRDPNRLGENAYNMLTLYVTVIDDTGRQFEDAQMHIRKPSGPCRPWSLDIDQIVSADESGELHARVPMMWWTDPPVEITFIAEGYEPYCMVYDSNRVARIEASLILTDTMSLEGTVTEFNGANRAVTRNLRRCTSA